MIKETLKFFLVVAISIGCCCGCMISASASEAYVSDNCLNEAVATVSDNCLDEAEATDSDSQLYEAEAADYVAELFDDSRVSGGKYVKITTVDTYCDFTVEVPCTGYYELVICSAGQAGEKWDNIYVDGVWTAYLYSQMDTFAEQKLESVLLQEGTHSVKIAAFHGWTKIDYLKISCLQSVNYEQIYGVSGQLSNENASDNARYLMSFISSQYGTKILAGQQCEDGFYGADVQRIISQTGRVPAIIGMDLTNWNNGTVDEKAIEQAMEFYEMGGIPSFCWHWITPERYYADANYGWSSFRTEYVNMDFSEIMNGNDEEGYELLMADIDRVGKLLQPLAEVDIPVLFRPLHEASGGWFWWGSDGPEPYMELWIQMYQKLTDEYGLNNLIWVWNGLDKDWYPGDEYVDIAGADIYGEKRDHDPHVQEFIEVSGYADTPKVTALTECGTLFDIDSAVADNTMWSWFCTWEGGHSVMEGEDVYTEPAVWTAVYNHEAVLTLDELPWHSHTDTDANNVCDHCAIVIDKELGPVEPAGYGFYEDTEAVEQSVSYGENRVVDYQVGKIAALKIYCRGFFTSYGSVAITKVQTGADASYTFTGEEIRNAIPGQYRILRRVTQKTVKYGETKSVTVLVG